MLRDLFVPDARFRFPGLGSFDDTESCIAAMRKALDGAQTVHHGHMPEIVITGETTATAIWAMYDLVRRPGSEASLLPGYDPELALGFEGFGHYHESYRKVGGDWKISALELRRILLRRAR